MHVLDKAQSADVHICGGHAVRGAPSAATALNASFCTDFSTYPVNTQMNATNVVLDLQRSLPKHWSSYMQEHALIARTSCWAARASGLSALQSLPKRKA